MARQIGSSGHEARRFTDSEATGYTIYSGSSPPDEIITRLKHSLQSNYCREMDPLVYGRGDPGACGELLRYGIDGNNVVCFLQ